MTAQDWQLPSVLDRTAAGADGRKRPPESSQAGPQTLRRVRSPGRAATRSPGPAPNSAKIDCKSLQRKVIRSGWRSIDATRLALRAGTGPFQDWPGALTMVVPPMGLGSSPDNKSGPKVGRLTTSQRARTAINLRTERNGAHSNKPQPQTNSAPLRPRSVVRRNVSRS